jgi:hypothetical protein
MAAERRDAHETTRTVLDIASLHGVMITKIEEAVRVKTEAMITATTAAITTIVNGGCWAILVEDVAIITTMMEIGAETTTGDDNKVLENPAGILETTCRNQATHRHRRHLHHPHHRVDICEGRMIIDNPPPPALGVELSVVYIEMSDGLKDSDLEQ